MDTALKRLARFAPILLLVKLLGIVLRIFAAVVICLVLVLKSLLIWLLWHDILTIGGVAWLPIVALHSAWIAIVSGLVALVVRPNWKSDSRGGWLFPKAVITSLTCLAIAIATGVLRANLPTRSLDTEADVRPLLETQLKLQVRSFPAFGRIEDLDRQIRNVRINGPAMTFEPETTRYITFDFDTGCGSVIEVQAVLGSDYPDELSSADRENCAP